MDGVLEKSAVKRVQQALISIGAKGQIKVLADSARSAAEAAAALGIEVGQIASSIIFKLPDQSPLLVITSGRHRVDTELVARQLGEDKLDRVDVIMRAESASMEDLGRTVLAKVQAVAGITRTLTCPVTTF